MHGMREFSVSELFDISLGSGRYTKTWCRGHQGEYPVYSGQTIGAYDYVDTYDYSDECLTWAKDGLAGYVRAHCGEQFCITNHRGILIPKDRYAEQICIPFFKYALEPLFRAARVGRLADGEQDEYTTLNKTAASRIKVKVPVLDDGVTLDYARQQKYADKMGRVDCLREKLSAMRRRLDSLDVDVLPLVETMPNAEVGIGDVFEVKRGKSLYTRTYMSDHPGMYPVYTAMTFDAAGAIDTFDYDGRYLTVSLNGLAGKVLEVDGAFSCTSDRAILVPKTEGLDLIYVKAVIEALLREQRHGRLAEGEKNEYTKLGAQEIRDTRFLIPVREDGSYDAEAQAHIANRYEHLLEMRHRISAEIDAICEIDISFEV